MLLTVRRIGARFDMEIGFLILALIYGAFLQVRLWLCRHRLDESNRQLHELSTKCRLQELELAVGEKRVKDVIDAKDALMNEAKSSLLQTVHELSQQLLAQSQTQATQIQSGADQRASAMQVQLESIASRLSVLASETNSSKSSISQIKAALTGSLNAGTLAELSLENILKGMNLQRGRDFEMQYSMSLEDGRRLRPDAVVFLPGDQVMIIDSKASVLMQQKGEDLQERSLDYLKSSMRSQLKALKSKEYKNGLREIYSRADDLCVLQVMFVPNELLLEKLCAHDPSFLSDAWSQDIFPVGPAGLVQMLNYSKFQMKAYRQSQNQRQITAEMIELLKSIDAVCGYAQKLGVSLKSATTQFDQFAAKLNAGVLKRVASLQRLGLQDEGSGDETKEIGYVASEDV